MVVLLRNYLECTILQPSSIFFRVKQLGLFWLVNRLIWIPTTKLFLIHQLNLGSSLVISTPFKYLEQKVSASFTTWPSTMIPSGPAWFRRYSLSVFMNLSKGYIHHIYTGPSSIASSGKCITKWTMISKNIGGNINSSLLRTNTMYSSTFSISSTLRFLEQICWKKL